MQRPKSDRYDYAFTLIGLVLTFAFLGFAKQSGWSVPLSIALLVVVSIPVGIVLGWLKHRLQSRRRGVR